MDSPTLPTFKPIQNSALFRWRLNNASHVNPIESLLKTDNRPSNPQEDVVSIITSLIALIAAISGGLAFYYVNTKTASFSDPLATGTLTIYNNSTAKIDKHHLLITNTSLILSLPDPSNYDFGRHISVALTYPLDSSIPTVSPPTAFINWTGGTQSFKLKPLQGALFIVSLELGTKKWKLVRQWGGTPEDGGFNAGQ